MEVGCWLWEAAASQVMRCFMVPRGSTILAGGTAAADSSVLEMKAEVGSESFGVLSNPHLAKAARCVRDDLNVSIEADACVGSDSERPGRSESRLREEPCQRPPRVAGSIPP